MIYWPQRYWQYVEKRTWKVVNNLFQVNISQYAYKSGPLSTNQLNAIKMASKRHLNGVSLMGQLGPILYAGLVFCCVTNCMDPLTVP